MTTLGRRRALPGTSLTRRTMTLATLDGRSALMPIYKREVDIPPSVTRDADFLLACEATILAHTADWPNRQVIATVEVRDNAEKAESLTRAFEGAEASPDDFDQLRLFVMEEGVLDHQASFWIRQRQSRAAGFVAQFSVATPNEVEAEGLPAVIRRLAERHEARLAQQAKATREESPAATRPAPWWREHLSALVITTVATVIGGLILAVVLGS